MAMMGRGIGAVVFDLDGTLLDHDGAAASAVRQIAATAGVADPAELVAAWRVLEDRHLEAYRAGWCSFAEQRRRRAREFLPLLGVPVGDDAALDAWFARHYLPAYEEAWRSYPDVVPCLDRLATVSGPPVLAVLTNGDTDQQHAKLTRLGLADRFAAILTSADLGVAKPDPQAFTLVCDTLGVDRVAAVYVGDRLDIDATAARDAGLTGIWLDRHHSTATHCDVGVPQIRSLTELVGVLEHGRPATKSR